MSFRDIPNREKAFTQMIRAIHDRLSRLERGGAVAGVVSFGDHVIIGGVDVTIVDTGGGHKNIVFSNPSTGLSSTISL